VPPTMGPPITAHAAFNYPGMPSPSPTSNGSNHHRASGVGRKARHFHEGYNGPKLAELNAVGASAKLMRNGNFVFTGTNQGKIKQAPAVYVWGIDRSCSLGPRALTKPSR